VEEVVALAERNVAKIFRHSILLLASMLICDHLDSTKDAGSKMRLSL
jgi:hypothetical protein